MKFAVFKAWPQSASQCFAGFSEQDGSGNEKGVAVLLSPVWCCEKRLRHVNLLLLLPGAESLTPHRSLP